MKDQKNMFTESEKRKHNRNIKNQEKNTLINNLKLNFTREKPGKETLKKYYNGII